MENPHAGNDKLPPNEAAPMFSTALGNSLCPKAERSEWGSCSKNVAGTERQN